MGKNDTNTVLNSPYSGSCIRLTTKHEKSLALAPPFASTLGAKVQDFVVDTDQLGTFSGEITRQGSVLETARKKCEWAIEANFQFALASEGSFGPHPTMPFLPADQETLYFIDNERQFHLYLNDISMDTNYKMAKIFSLDELLSFSETVLFPSHALIVRPYPENAKKPIYKGIINKQDLEAAFIDCQKRSQQQAVWVETDMRAHLNPTRMSVIRQLGEKLANRLACTCPNCMTPGWGVIDVEVGLPCAWCGQPTSLIKSEIVGCAKCSYRESQALPNAQQQAEPKFCGFCNP